MKTTFRLIVAILLLAGWGLAASAMHVIRTAGAPIIIPKDRLAIRDTYVDVRNWTLDDVTQHPSVCRRLIATGKVDALAGAVKSSSGAGDLVAQLNAAISNAPATSATPVADKIHALAAKAETAVVH
jgi:hypothetical protein